MILVLDNYDSFTYNLTALLQCAGAQVLVFRNDELSVSQIEGLQPKGILISPGPGEPHETGVCREAVLALWDRIPILGVCLGHQLIAQMCGANITRAVLPMHGKTSIIQHCEKRLFKEISNPLQVMRYHSLVIDREALPEDVFISAFTDDGEIMAIEIRSKPCVMGVQFHPESILTAQGLLMISNWLEEIKHFANNQVKRKN